MKVLLDKSFNNGVNGGNIGRISLRNSTRDDDLEQVEGLFRESANTAIHINAVIEEGAVERVQLYINITNELYRIALLQSIIVLTQLLEDLITNTVHSLLDRTRTSSPREPPPSAGSGPYHW